MRSLLFIAVIVCAFGVAAVDPSAGVIVLDAKDAKIEGGNARYDAAPVQRCIRYWSTTNTVARWTVDIPARGAYRVRVEYSCAPPVAGSEFEVVIGNQKANGIVQGTQRWTVFQEQDLGPVIVRKPGPVEVSVRSTRVPRGTVWDLRAIRLVPEP